jgi:predicted acylesterase/phospholipase RssA
MQKQADEPLPRAPLPMVPPGGVIDTRLQYEGLKLFMDNVDKQKTAWCLGGGGSYCIYQFGMIKRLWELGHRPDIVIGTSGGALNALGVAQGDIEIMERVWQKVTNKDVRSFAPWQLWQKNKASIYCFDPLKKSLGRFINPELLKKSTIELYVTCTSLDGNCAVRFRLSGKDAHPDPATILHASCSPPILVPPSGGTLYDGGLSDNYNVGLAIELGATHIVMMHPNRPRRHQINNVFDAIEAAIAIPMWNNYCREIDMLACIPADKRPKLTVIQPAQGMASFSMFDFDFKGLDRDEMIAHGYKLAAKIF